MGSDLPLLVIVGPTASGKTEMSLTLAESLDGEIISADSVQIYRHFDIGSGKPRVDELARVPHHFIGTHDPLDEVDAATWANLAEHKLIDIIARGKQPIVCGGSYLWVRALLYGLAPAPAADANLRAEHRHFVEVSGRAALHRRLAEVDRESAEKLAPNDFVRVSRALEVYQLTGKRMSQWQAEHGFREPKRPYRLLGVKRERAELDQRIYTRAEAMFEHGLVTEVMGLCLRGYENARAMRSVGYREVCDAIRGHAGSQQPASDMPGQVRANALVSNVPTMNANVDKAALLDAIARKTRIFARRQRTWLRDAPVRWISPELVLDPLALMQAVLREP